MSDARHRCRVVTVLVPILTVIVLLTSVLSGAGQTTAVLEGTVVDASGAVLPGVTVTIRSTETGTVRTAVTEATGRYRSTSLQVGRYDAQADLESFQTQVVEGINLTVGATVQINFTLAIGSLASEVTVTATAAIVDTSTVSTPALVGEREVKDLPLNGRSFDNLITLSAGTSNFTSTRGGGGVSGNSNLFSISGRRPTENQFLMNGVPFIGLGATNNLPGGVSGQLLGIDAIREFTVQKDSYSADMGGRAGGQISAVTMSGSNAFHGSVFEFHRNSALDAKNFFDSGDIPPFRRNNFGASAGGPILPSKLFFFANYEGLRESLGLSSVAIVPDENARRGFLPDPQRPGELVNIGLAPGVADYFRFWPLPNGRNLGDGTAVSSSNPQQTIKEDFFTTRVDYNVTPTNTLSFSWLQDGGTKDAPGANPYAGSILDITMKVGTAELKQVLSNNMVNTFKFGYTRAVYYFDTFPTIDYPNSLAFVAGSHLGVISVGAAGSGSAAGGGGLTQAGSLSGGQNQRSWKTQLTFQDSLEVNKGRHLLGLGFWGMAIRYPMRSVTSKNGLAAFAGLTEFMQGRMRSFEVSLEFPIYTWESNQFAWYLQDTIRLGPRVTANVGLRHEIWLGWNEKDGHASNFLVKDPGTDVLPDEPTVGKTYLVEQNGHWLFGPRAGLVWDVTGNGKTALRGGFGIYYSLQDELAFSLQKNPPFTRRIQLNEATFPLHLTRDQQNVPDAVVSPASADAYMQMPRVHRYNVSLQQQIGSAIGVSVAYVGSRGYNDQLNIHTNTAAPIICSSAARNCPAGLADGTKYHLDAAGRPLPFRNPRLGRATQPFFFLGHSDYHALQVEFASRPSRGVSFRGNYTLSRSQDTSSVLSTNDGRADPSNIQDPTDIEANWGLSSYDVTHRLSFNATYAVPELSGGSSITRALLSDWQFNGIVNVQTGMPFTATVGFNRSRDGSGGGADRPDLAPGADLSKAILGTPDRWFDPTVFVLPVNGTYGNAGRTNLRMPGVATVDFSVFRLVPLTAGMNLQFRCEVFNLFNRANFGIPSKAVFNSNGTYRGAAGRITETSTSSRQVQLGMKLIW